MTLKNGIVEHQEPRDRAYFSELRAKITIVRDPGFFVWKFIVPLSILMIVISYVLWIPPSQIKDRLGLTITGLLTSAAYGFTISRYLPEHVYDTYLDAVSLSSMFYSSALMLVNVITYRLDAHKHTELANKIDMISRFAFPIGFLITLFALRLR
jgi:hypothetical protein